MSSFSLTVCVLQLSDSYDVVVNCSGMRARDLVGDKTLKPVRGQVLRVCGLRSWFMLIYNIYIYIERNSLDSHSLLVHLFKLIFGIN